MDQLIDRFVDELIAVVRAESGISYAPDDPPSTIATTPAAIVWLTDGRSVIGPPDLATFHVGVRIGLVTSMQSIAVANQRILPRVQPVIQAIWGALKDSTFTHTQNIERINFTYGPIEWGAVWYFGALIDLEDVKLQAAI